MADPIEMTALTTTGSILSGDYLWLKRGVSDFKVTIANLFGWHTDDLTNPHGTTKAQVGLGNVSNDAQLKIASNLSDLADANTARTNLGVDSKVNTDANLAAHTALTNPHNLTLALLGFEKLHNYEISNSFTLNSGTRYASSKAVYDGLADLLSTIENSLHKKGDIIMWFGSKTAFNASSRAANWAICDGAYNANWGGNVPDLTGRFPRGSLLDDTLLTGGTDTNVHGHNVQVLGHPLTKEEMPRHTHKTNVYGGGSEGGGFYVAYLAGDGTNSSTGKTSYTGGSDTAEAESNGDNHIHPVSQVNAGTTDGNIPSFHAVHFIIKVL